MATLAILTDGTNDSHIAVNLDQIRFVRPGSDGALDHLFDNDQSLPVKEKRRGHRLPFSQGNKWA